jgi:hypothetical protein
VGLAQDTDDILGRAGRFLHDLRKIFPQSIMRHTAMNGDVQVRHFRELEGVIWVGKDRLAEIFAHFTIYHIERRAKFDVADMIPAQIHVHEPGDTVSLIGIAVKMDTLNKR